MSASRASHYAAMKPQATVDPSAVGPSPDRRDVWRDQSALTERLEEFAKLYDEAARPVFQNSPATATKLRNLARRILVACFDADRPEQFLPLLLPESPPNERRREVCLRAVAGGMLTAWFETHFQRLEREAETSVIAVLLRDISLLAPLASRRTVEHHARLSAAIATTIPGLPVAYRRAIARHHERLDGTGVPWGLGRSELGQEDRMLMLIDRFVELWEQERTAASEHFASGEALSAMRSAHAELFHEARRGEFDLTLAVNLTRSLGLEVPTGRAVVERDPVWFAISSAGRRRFRLDPQHESMARPHFAGGAEAGERTREEFTASGSAGRMRRDV